MPEILPAHAPRPVAVLGWDGTRYRVFAVDPSGHIQADVLTSGLPAGAATEATLAELSARVGDEVAPAAGSVNAQLALAVTALQLIDDLRNALQTVATDRLQVRGENQLFSIMAPWAEFLSDLNAGAGANTLSASTVPANRIWIANYLMAINVNTAVAPFRFLYWDGAVDRDLYRVGTLAANTPVLLGTPILLSAGCRLRAYFGGCAAGDDLYFSVVGYKMTLEV